MGHLAEMARTRAALGFLPMAAVPDSDDSMSLLHPHAVRDLCVSWFCDALKIVSCIPETFNEGKVERGERGKDMNI